MNLKQLGAAVAATALACVSGGCGPDQSVPSPEDTSYSVSVPAPSGTDAIQYDVHVGAFCSPHMAQGISKPPLKMVVYCLPGKDGSGEENVWRWRDE